MLKAVVRASVSALPRSLITRSVCGFRCSANLRKDGGRNPIRGSYSANIPNGVADLEGILDYWRHRKTLSSHDSLTRCLYHSLKAASAQDLPPVQLAQVPKFQAFWQHLCRSVPTMSANSAVMCLYNCAQYDFRIGTSCFPALVEVCLQKGECIAPKSFGILLWSLYKLDLYEQSKALVNKVVQRFHSELLSGEEFKPQTFANVLWVLARSHTWPESITAEVMEYVPQRIGHFDFHSLSIVLWAVTTAGLPLSDAFLGAIGDRAAFLLQTQLPVISLVHCCWAFGSAAHYHGPFFSAVKDRFLAEPLHSPTLTPRVLASVVWSCARTGYYHSDLLDHIAAAALGIIHRFNSQDLGNLAYSYGYLNHSSDKLLLAISHIVSSQPEMAANELACTNVANACLIHRIYPESLLEQLMSYKRVSVLLQDGASKHLNLCVQIHSLVQTERPDLKSCLLQPPHDKTVPALVLAESMARGQRVYSVFHRNICKALLQITGSTQHFTREAMTTFSSFVDAEIILECEGKVLPIPPQWNGWSQPRQLLRKIYPVKQNAVLWQELDSACSKLEGNILDVNLPEEVCTASDWADKLGHPSQYVARKIVFEADGPRHYAVNCTHKLGNTVLKHRLLSAKGWDVIAIPYFEWQQLATDQDHINYLACRIHNNKKRDLVYN